MKTIQLCQIASACRRWVKAPGAWARMKTRTRDEVAALRLGIALGMTLIDTAEMYGEGGEEKSSVL